MSVRALAIAFVAALAATIVFGATAGVVAALVFVPLAALIRA